MVLSMFSSSDNVKYFIIHPQSGLTPLHAAAKRSNNLEIHRMLIAAGARADALDEVGNWYMY